MRGTDYGYSTDWYSLLMRDFSYDLNQYLAIDGSTKNGSYNASANYKKATGLDTRAGREEFGGRVAVEQRAIKNHLQLNFSLNARRVNEEWGNDGMFDTGQYQIYLHTKRQRGNDSIGQSGRICRIRSSS